MITEHDNGPERELADLADLSESAELAELALPADATPPGDSPHREERPLHPQEQARLEQVAAYPFIALTIQTTGIHPTTGRIVTVDAVTYDAAGARGQEFHAVCNPEIDPGPKHQHGLSREEIEAGQQFSRILKPLGRLLDGRTLVVNDAAYTWGFLVHEARRAMTAAARANRSRHRAKGRRRRHKVGHVPRPVAIVDTLATTWRRGIVLADVRLPAVAAANGINTDTATGTSPVASHAQHTARPEAEVSREHTELLQNLERHQAAQAGVMVTLNPEELTGDRFGLQRSSLRVDAANAPRLHHNSGKFAGVLRRGMEFVVAPEVSIDPDELIAAGVREELNYVEKLSRETSVVVCNAAPGADLRGKAMHAHRKDIPLISDQEFLEILTAVADPLPAEVPEDKHPPASKLRRRTNKRRPRRASVDKSTGQPERQPKAAHKPRSNPAEGTSTGGEGSTGTRRRSYRGGNRRRRGKSTES